MLCLLLECLPDPPHHSKKTNTGRGEETGVFFTTSRGANLPFIVEDTQCINFMALLNLNSNFFFCFLGSSYAVLGTQRHAE